MPLLIVHYLREHAVQAKLLHWGQECDTAHIIHVPVVILHCKGLHVKIYTLRNLP